MEGQFLNPFEVDLAWEADRHGVLTAGRRPLIVGGPPPEFEGHASWWSPEHLLVGAVALSLMTAYLTLAARESVPIGAYRSRAKGTLAKAGEGLELARMVVHVDVKTPVGRERAAEGIMGRAEKLSIVSRSLKADVEVILRVSAS